MIQRIPLPRVSIAQKFRKIVRTCLEELRPTYNWDGVYDQFEQVSIAGSSFDGGRWAAETRRVTEAVRAENVRGTIPGTVHGDGALLPLLGSVIAESGRLRVVDFGGGTGISYEMLTSALVLPCDIDYVVVETPRVAREGAALHRDDRSVRFVSEVPDELELVDVVFISTALQYVDDWKGLLRRLADLRPRYFLLSRLSAGEGPTYVAAQVNLKGLRIPYRFLNLQLLLDAMKSQGYTLCFKAASTVEVNQENYPPDHRLGRLCNLLFVPEQTRG